MAVFPKQLATPRQIPNSVTTIYTSTNVKTIIDRCVICNTTGTAATLELYLVESGGTAGTSNQAIKTRSIAAGETYLCPEVAGQILSDGGTLQTNSGTNNALSIILSGRQISGS